MWLTRLEVSGVRNLTSVSIDCVQGLNLFVGPNGAGKTAIIEAVHLLARGRSFRSTTIAPMIQHGKNTLMVRSALHDESRRELELGIERCRDGRSALRVDGRPERRASEIARLLPIQLMLPDASSLVFGGPQGRRRFIDWGAFHVKPSYLEELRDYQRTSLQRNAALRSLKGRSPSLTPELVAWTTRLIGLARIVDGSRRDYLAALFPLVAETLRDLGLDLALELSYYPGYREGSSLEDCLREDYARDARFGVTHSGPHRGDLRLWLGPGRAAATLSRGQAKVVASALLLAQAELTTRVGGRRSLFLIDDIGAELDARHNERFFRALEATDCQVFATAATEVSLGGAFLGSARKLFHVEHGVCRPFDGNEP